jgi:hypothetical protein
MRPLIRTTNHITSRIGKVRPYCTIWEKTAAGMARMRRNSTAQRFSRPGAGRTGRAGYSSSSREKGG